MHRIVLAALLSFLPSLVMAQGISNPGPVSISGGVTGLGTGVATLLTGTSSGTVGPAGTLSPNITTPTLSGQTAFEGGATAQVASMNSTAASGTYFTFKNSGAAFGDVGAGAQIISGAAATDLAVNARSTGCFYVGQNFVQLARFCGAGMTLAGATQTLSNAAFTTCTALTTVANVLTCTVSDRRMKTNIRSYAGNIDGLFKNVSPKVYTFKKGTPYYDNNRPRLGLIAQDVQKYVPEAVFPTGPGKPLQIDHAALDAAMFAEIKSLRTRVARLEGKIK